MSEKELIIIINNEILNVIFIGSIGGALATECR